MMPHDEDHFQSHDRLSLYRQCWPGERESTAVVIVVHGFTEHSGRYAEVARRLNRQGYAVYAADLRGHGKSAGERVFVRSFDEYVDDLALLVEIVRKAQPGKPLFLFGHSMGGAIVARFALLRRSDVQGLAMSAPAVAVGGGVFPMLRRLAAAVSWVFPRLRIVRMGLNWVSRDAEVVAQFRSDPLVFHGRFPVRTGAEILQAAARLQEDAAALQYPLLVLQGTGDRVVDPKGVQRFFERAGAEDKTLRLYDGLYHDLLHEPEKEQITADLIEWLGRLLAKQIPPC